MDTSVTVSRLSVPEKLRLMEELWADLSKRAETLATPKWHLDVLADREKLARQGKARFSSWSEVKKRLRRKAG